MNGHEANGNGAPRRQRGLSKGEGDDLIDYLGAEGQQNIELEISDTDIENLERGDNLHDLAIMGKIDRILQEKGTSPLKERIMDVLVRSSITSRRMGHRNG